jgi:CD109 antigen
VSLSPEKSIQNIEKLILILSLEIREEVKVNVLATENMKYLSFHVIGRGNVLVSRTIRVMNKNTASFKFMSTFDMMPNAKLLVFYYRSNGEIVSDVRTLKFNRKLDNFVSISQIFARLVVN